MSALTLVEALQKPAGHLSRLSSEELFALKHEAVRIATAAKANVEIIDTALSLKYTDRAQLLRLQAGKDTGAVTFADGLVKVTADLPKKVEWDQTMLAKIAENITKGGDDPKEFIELSYHVSESKFNAWNSALKAAFLPARTVNTGKANFKLVMDAETVAQHARVAV